MSEPTFNPRDGAVTVLAAAYTVAALSKLSSDEIVSLLLTTAAVHAAECAKPGHHQDLMRGMGKTLTDRAEDFGDAELLAEFRSHAADAMRLAGVHTL